LLGKTLLENMVIKTDYKNTGEFAKEYIKRDGSVGTGRAYIHELIHDEIKQPGSTGIDVMIVGSKAPFIYLVRYSEPVVNVKPIEEQTADILQSIMSKI
jgi:hypothetical protein